MVQEKVVKDALSLATNNNPTWLVMKALYNETGSDFRDRIPEPTATNVAEFGAALLADRTSLNTFATSIVEKFARTFFNDTLINNKLKVFKKGKVETGFKLEEIFVRVAKGTKYDPDNAYANELKRTLPATETIIHIENSRLEYDATMSQAEVKTAFTSWDGVNTLFVKIIQSMYDGYELDEFSLMKELIIQYAKRGFFKFVKVDPIADKASAEEFVITAKTYSNLLEFPSDEYNAMDVIRQTPKSEQHLILRAKEDARISVQALAAAFNMTETNFYGHKQMLDNFGDISNAFGALISENWFQVYDTDEEMNSLYVRKGRYWNYTYHRWGIFSISRFEPAILFITSYDNPVTSVTVTPTLDVVKRGKTRDLQALVNIVDDTTLPEGTEPTLSGGTALSKEVTWKLEGNLKTGTKLTNETGTSVTLEVAEDETAKDLRVTATSKDNTNAIGSALIQVGDFFGN